MSITVEVKNNKLNPSRIETSVVGSENLDKIVFKFGAEWNNLYEDIIFYPLKGEPVTVISGGSYSGDRTTTVSIPNEVLAYSGVAKYTIKGYDTTRTKYSVTGYIVVPYSVAEAHRHCMHDTHTDNPIEQIRTQIKGDIDEAIQARIDAGDIKGKAATIKVGEVKTLAPDKNADVKNSGTVNDAVLDFSIPKGEKGDKGVYVLSNGETLQNVPDDADIIVDPYSCMNLDIETGIIIRGFVESEDDLEDIDAHQGDVYAVGEEAPYDVYVYNVSDDEGEWIDMGEFTVAKGDKGEDGADGSVISSVVKTGESADGKTTEYTMYFEDGHSYKFTVTNGTNPTQEQINTALVNFIKADSGSLGTLNVTKNGTHTAFDSNLVGYKKVTVNVPNAYIDWDDIEDKYTETELEGRSVIIDTISNNHMLEVVGNVSSDTKYIKIVSNSEPASNSDQYIEYGYISFDDNVFYGTTYGGDVVSLGCFIYSNGKTYIPVSNAALDNDYGLRRVSDGVRYSVYVYTEPSSDIVADNVTLTSSTGSLSTVGQTIDVGFTVTTSDTINETNLDSKLDVGMTTNDYIEYVGVGGFNDNTPNTMFARFKCKKIPVGNNETVTITVKYGTSETRTYTLTVVATQPVHANGITTENASISGDTSSSSYNGTTVVFKVSPKNCTDTIDSSNITISNSNVTLASVSKNIEGDYLVVRATVSRNTTSTSDSTSVVSLMVYSKSISSTVKIGGKYTNYTYYKTTGAKFDNTSYSIEGKGNSMTTYPDEIWQEKTTTSSVTPSGYYKKTSFKRAVYTSNSDCVSLSVDSDYTLKITAVKNGTATITAQAYFNADSGESGPFTCTTKVVVTGCDTSGGSSSGSSGGSASGDSSSSGGSSSSTEINPVTVVDAPVTLSNRSSLSFNAGTGYNGIYSIEFERTSAGSNYPSIVITDISSSFINSSIMTNPVVMYNVSAKLSNGETVNDATMTATYNKTTGMIDISLNKYTVSGSTYQPVFDGTYNGKIEVY